ncbi:MAG: KTSC domain-containing protein [Pedobacter sp.]|nr:MAG: KTSC domain-containing protein [Pedobacter sp.]
MPSSVIDHFTYNEQAKTLKITFLAGMVYLYEKVPIKICETLKISGSKGRYFNHYIKDKFKFKKLED